MSVRQIDIQYVDKLHPVYTKPKRIKIIVGGRGSTKSTGVADYVIGQLSVGALWCCAREHMNSIEESVHRTMLDEITRLEIPGFEDTKTAITHNSGGRAFYKGLSRNITSLKSTLSGVDGLWIEEGEDLSDDTIRVLTASVRLNATDTQRALAGEDVKMPEIIITMNRGARTGAVAKKWLARAEKQLERTGYYEDDLLMVVQMNYTDMPKEWFLQSGLEEERIDDLKTLSRAKYDHKWLGHYLDAVDDAIIETEWFDAAIDAHKKLGFKPKGVKVVSHDPSDKGPDNKGLAYRHGSVVLDVQEKEALDVNEGCDWATGYAIDVQADSYVWDADGIGAALRKQTLDNFRGKKISHVEFRGSKGVDNPKKVYQPTDDNKKAKTNQETFKNRRAQYYWSLRDRFYKTYRAVVHGDYIDPDDMISLSSEIEAMSALRAEVCRIPRRPNGQGLIQIMSKEEMARQKPPIASPNMADALMMSEAGLISIAEFQPLNFSSVYG
jgi:phage terminase large subunit